MRVTVICEGEELVVCGGAAAATLWLKEHDYKGIFVLTTTQGDIDMHVLPTRVVEAMERAHQLDLEDVHAMRLH